MVKNKIGMLLLGIVLFPACLQLAGNKKNEYNPMISLKNIQEVAALFPKTSAEITHKGNQILKDTQKRINDIIAIPKEKRTFTNTMRALDTASFYFSVVLTGNEVISYTSSDDALRTTAQQESIKLMKHSVELFSQNEPLYSALKEYVTERMPQETLTEQERYFVTETMKDYKKSGLELPTEQQKVIGALKKELAELGTEFEKNIAEDTSSITVPAQALKGLSDDFIAALPKTAEGLCIVGVDYPTFFAVMEQCSVERTRKLLYEAFGNRAYPRNIAVLEKVIAKRDELAKLLGFPSYAALDIDSEMAHDPEVVETFLDELLGRVSRKATQEFKELCADLPPEVKLTYNNRLNPWDIAFTKASYKKKHFNIDEQRISEYFPMENTIEELLDIYAQFMNLEFKQIASSGFWSSDMRAIEVYRGQKKLGYLLLDLFPRKNKFSHACQITVVPAIHNAQGAEQEAVGVVLANFPQATESKPSLLKKGDVITFFHEFGHALHAILGSTQLASLSGTSVKRDFVEMPSQMLEEWLWDAAILKKVSHHYQTGESLPEEIIEAIIKNKNFDTGSSTQRQILLAKLSLEYFKEGAIKNTTEILYSLAARIRSYQALDKNTHMQASFGHLMGYGSKYYGYLWSKVFALDLFYYIREYGLLDPVIGARYVDAILSKGGSADPNELLRNFLQRNPNQNAFLHDLGLQS